MPTEPARNGRADDQPCTNPAEGRPAASHGSLVDGHVGRYAARARDMAASEIRALFAVATRPEIVSLAGGLEICPRGGSYDHAALGWGGGARTSTCAPGQTEFHVPARLSPAESRAVTEAAVTTHHALGLRDISRTDLISSAGQAFFLEVSVVPGMTETSALPMALVAAGRSLGPVCRDLLGQAAARGT